MRRALALTTLVLVAGCGGGGSEHAQPAPSITLPPTTAIKDALLVAAVKATLAGDDLDSAQHVGVTVRAGVATLTGNVRTAAQKERDVKLAAGVTGITSVIDRLHVGGKAGATKSAADLALSARVAGSLAAQTGVNALGVHVGALDGSVTLEGRAPTPAIKETMLDVTRKTAGVRNVVDKIVVRN